MQQARYKTKIITKELLALRFLREQKGLQRKAAATLCGTSAKALEQLENGRSGYSQAKLEKVIVGLGYSMPQYKELLELPHDALRVGKRISIKRVYKLSDRRSYRREITRITRTIKILRLQKDLTQREAALLCGFSQCTFGHIENGRREFKESRIKHIVESLGFTMADFNAIQSAPVMRDDLLIECSKVLPRISTDKLELTLNLLKSMKG